MKNIVNVSEYPYGKINKRMWDISKWMNKNQNKLKNDLAAEKIDMFDYPDYWGIPKKLTRHLDTDELDFLQEQLNDFYLKHVRDCY